MAIEVPKPDYDDPKETFALYGLAVYSANLIEQSLIHLAAVLQLPDVGLLTREAFERTFEELDEKTLGTLLGSARKLTTFPEELDDALNEVLRKRNYLIHRFFLKHAEDAMSITGRREMIDELIQTIQFFSSVDPQLEQIYLPLWERYGVDDAYMDREWHEMQKRVSERDGA